MKVSNIAKKLALIISIMLLTYMFLTNGAAQDFSGRFVGTDAGSSNKVLDLEFDGSGYSGIISIGAELAYIEGEIEEEVLIGIYSFGERADGYITAIQEGDFVLVNYAPLSADGNIDETQIVELLLQRESETTNPVTNPNPTPSTNPNPLASLPQTVELTGQDIQYGVQYSEGASLKSDFVGISFSVPTNGQAFYSPEQGFTLGHSAVMSGGFQLIALSNGNLSAIVTDMLSVEEDMQLIPLEQVEQTETYIKGKFQLLTEDVVAYKEIRAAQSGAGQIVILLGTGFLHEADQVSVVMDEIETSFRFGTPKLDEVRQLAASFSGVNFSASSGGSQAPGVVSGSSFSLDLCSSQEFRLFEDSVFSISVNDPLSGDFVGGGRSESEEESFGTWELGATLAGPAILLQKRKGGFDYFEMLELQGTMFLNAKPVQASQSQICQ